MAAGFPSSQRLLFRAWTQDDLPLARSLWTDPGVMGHMGGPMTEDEVQARLELEMSRQRTLGVQYWPMFLRGTGEFAGCAGLRPWRDETNVFEAGVHVARRFWSERLGEDAAHAVARFAFGELGVAALTAGHGPNNVNSKALLERLGFRYTHAEPWGRLNTMHPYYRLEREEYGTGNPRPAVPSADSR
jgi:[ribosomal protein S5]-alanine N-acetyltransferase